MTNRDKKDSIRGHTRARSGLAGLRRLVCVSRVCGGRGPVAERPSGVEVLARARHVQPVADLGDIAADVVPGAGRFSPGGVPGLVAAEPAAVPSTVT